MMENGEIFYKNTKLNLNFDKCNFSSNNGLDMFKTNPSTSSQPSTSSSSTTSSYLSSSSLSSLSNGSGSGNNNNIISIFEEFKIKLIPYLIGYRESDRIVISTLEQSFEIIEKCHKEDLESVSTEFKRFARSLRLLETGTTRKINSNFEANKRKYQSIKQQLQKDKETIQAIIERSEKTSSSSIDLNKLAQDIENTNKLIQNKSTNRFTQFTTNNIISLDEDSFQKCIVIESEPYIDRSIDYLMINKEITRNDGKPSICYVCNGEPIPNGVKDLVLNSNFPYQGLIPNTVTSISFNNCYPDSINERVVPRHVQSLYLYDIKKPLTIGSIPNTITELVLGDGFPHAITVGMIPNSVSKLYLYDITQPPTKKSIPNSVTELILGEGYNHLVTAESIPASVVKLLVYNIHVPLTVSSIPNTVKELVLAHGYNFTLNAEVIPKSVQRLYFGCLKKPLGKLSIPHFIKELYLCNGFNQAISSDILPEGLKKLFIIDYQSQIKPGSMPCNKIKEITMSGSFAYPIQPGVIPGSVKKLCFNNNFSQPILPNTIPSSVQSLYLGSMDHPLLPGSIPPTVKEVILMNSFSHKIQFGVVPETVDKLIIDQSIKISINDFHVSKLTKKSFLT